MLYSDNLIKILNILCPQYVNHTKYRESHYHTGEQKNEVKCFNSVQNAINLKNKSKVGIN